MSKGVIISGIGHVGLILWAILGGWLFAAHETPEIQVVEVSMISTAEFDAMMSAAPSVPDVAPEPAQPTEAAVEPAVEPPAEPDAAPVEPAPEVAPAPPDPAPPEPAPELPVDPAPQPEPVPEPVAPPADLPQPIRVPRSSVPPRARSSVKISDAPPEPVTDAPDIADTPAPPVTDVPAPDVPEPPEPPATPEVTAPEVTPDPPEVVEDAPQLAPTSSKRPQSRPDVMPVDDLAALDAAAADKAAQKAADQEAADKAAAVKAAKKAADQAASDQASAEKAAIDAAVAAAAGTGTETANDGPKGPPMTNSEIGDLHQSIESKWNIGALSTEAAQVVIKVAVVLSPDQKPVSIELISGEGGSDVAIKRAFDAARSAIYRAATEGLNLPPDKYDEWKDLIMTFDPRSGTLN